MGTDGGQRGTGDAPDDDLRDRDAPDVERTRPIAFGTGNVPLAQRATEAVQGTGKLPRAPTPVPTPGPADDAPSPRDRNGSDPLTALEKPTANARPRASTASPETIVLPSAPARLPATTVGEAMHAEEVRRTRQFIAIGWAISVAAIATVPFLGAARWMNIAMITALLWGIVMSSVFYRRFADPTTYTPAALTLLGALAIVNTQVAVMYFGVFTPSAVILVLGMHFLARSEAECAARRLFATAVGAYLASALVIIAGVVPDPGIFASTAPQEARTLALGALFVIGCYALAFYTGRAIRAASLASIDGLQRQTRLAAQRKALMDELRADLERALHVGGPGRHTEHEVGSFRLGNVIGRGATGEVYEATHTVTGEVAAVKLLRRELLTDATHVARFLREAKTSGALASPHVVRVLEACAGKSLPFLAMERLHGQTLAEMLRGESRLDAGLVVAMCKQVGAGIDAAGAAGIVHRDLKPQNLMLAAHGDTQRWKILDFGAATLADDPGTLTQGGIIGTPSYMAPEQARGERLDGRADVYALGAVAYRCLTGRHPFTAPDLPALLYAVVHRRAHRPGELGPFSEDVDRWAAIALAKAPADRFATGAALAAALALAVRGDLDARSRRRGDALIKKYGWDLGT